MFAKAVIVVFAVLTAASEAGRSYQDKYTIDHAYYTMSVYQDNADGTYDKYHVDMKHSTKHDFLSAHAQAAEAVAPGFDFPFYGHFVDQFFITTHGFLSFAPRLHNLMYKTQYIAPLRVKLDPSRSNESTVDYLAYPDKLTIQWTNVTVAEPYEHPSGGNFTIQVTLFENGDIVFVYVQVPELLTSDALYDNEPVAGLSDAFLIGDSELHVYHTMNVDNPDINTQTVVFFKAKPTCIQQQTCETCAALSHTSEFRCSWCPKIHRCSDGADRLREHWDTNGCGETNSTGFDQCNAVPSDDQKHTEWRTSMTGESGVPVEDGGNVATIISVVVSLILVLILIGLVGAFVFMYGRNNPGGIAERIAMRLEANYKRFGGEADDQVQLEKPKKEQQQNNNNNDTTIVF